MPVPGTGAIPRSSLDAQPTIAGYCGLAGVVTTDGGAYCCLLRLVAAYCSLLRLGAAARLPDVQVVLGAAQTRLTHCTVFHLIAAYCR